MTPISVLIVEDDSVIAQFVAASLSAAGLRPVTVGNAAQARQAVRNQLPQMVIADLGLPDADGVDLIAEWRRASPAGECPLPPQVPILVLSARTQEAEKIAALDAGADDYLSKPFGAGELLARVRAMLRRAKLAGTASVSDVLRAGALVIDRGAHSVVLNGQPLHLTPIEFKLLERLARAPGQVVTHRQLLTDVWGSDQTDQLHYLRIYMGHLRAKIEADPAQPRYLLTELGVGYRMGEG